MKIVAGTDFEPDAAEARRAALAASCIARATALGLKLAIVESCTGGAISAALVAVPGASRVFESGMVAYSNEAKSRLAGSAEVFIEHGSVSIEAARALALAMARQSGADIALASTGITGPGGATDLKPVGMHCLAIARNGALDGVFDFRAKDGFRRDRSFWQSAFTETALRELAKVLGGDDPDRHQQADSLRA